MKTWSLSLVLKTWSLSLVFICLSILVYGYDYGLNANQSQILPFIYKINNPLLFANDPYVKTLSQFPSIYCYMMAFLGRFFNLQALHLFIYIIIKYLFFLAVFYLSYAIFKSRKISYLTLLIFALSPLANAFGLMGQEPVMKASLYQTSFITPFAIFSIYFFITKRYTRALVITAILCYINFLLADFLIIMFAFCLFYLWIYERKSLAGVSRSIIIFLCILAPGIVWYILNKVSYGAAHSQDFALWLRLWYPGHYFPSCWNVFQWKRTVLYLSIFLMFFGFSFIYTDKAKFLKPFIYAFFMMWSIAFISGEFLKLNQIISLQFFRSDVFFMALGLIFAACYIYKMLESRNLQHLVMGLLLFFAVVEFNYPLIAPAVIILWVLFLARERMRAYLCAFLPSAQELIILLNKLIVIFFLLMCLVNLMVYPEMTVKILVFAALLILYMFSLGDFRINTKVASIIIILSMTGAAFIHINLMIYRVKNNVFVSRSKIDVQWKDVQLWVKDNTPQDALFIVPPYVNSFRVYAKRSPFVEWIDGAAMHWSPGYEEIWVSRLGELGYDRWWLKTFSGGISGLSPIFTHQTVKRIYNRIYEKRLFHLKSAYGADYVIVPIKVELRLPKLYENKNFKVYRIS